MNISEKFDVLYLAWELEKMEFIHVCTIPKTNSSHLKMDDWNTLVSFWEFWPMIRCELLVWSQGFGSSLQGNQARHKVNRDVRFEKLHPPEKCHVAAFIK